MIIYSTGFLLNNDDDDDDDDDALTKNASLQRQHDQGGTLHKQVQSAAQHRRCVSNLPTL